MNLVCSMCGSKAPDNAKNGDRCQRPYCGSGTYTIDSIGGIDQIMTGVWYDEKKDKKLSK